MAETQWQIYLKNEYNNTMNVADANKDLISVEPDKGENVPYVTNYLVTFKVPTWVKPGRTIKKQNSTVVRITLQDKDVPHAHVVKGDIPYHTNWFTNGLVCNGHAVVPRMRVVDYIIFVLELLQFKAQRIDVTSAANGEAASYWNANKNDRDKFPTDTRVLKTNVDPKPASKPAIRIKSSHY